MNNIRNILIDNENWHKYKLNHSELDLYRISEIEKMLKCCDSSRGFFYGYCEHCKEDVIMHFKCNSKICSRCGKKYVDKWVERAKKKVFKEMHRMVTLTIPSDLRDILEDRWDLLKILQDSAHETIQEVANRTLRKKVKVGVLVGLQTYGQDMKFHPHLHCIVLEKVRYKNSFINFNYIPKEMFRKVWQKIIIKNLSKANIIYKDKMLIISMLEKYPNGFVTYVGNSSMNINQVVRYLARYMRHPAIADSRLIFYGKGRITIRMKDKQKREYSIWFYIEEFIDRLVKHISPKQFRIVRWYGLYSRREVRLERIESKDRQETISFFLYGKRKIIQCPKCNSPLKDVFYVINKPPDNRKLMNKLDYWIN